MSENKKDTQGQQNMSIMRKYDPILFHADHGTYILYGRIENISAAIYLITSTLPEHEDLRMSLRKKALQCISCAGASINSKDKKQPLAVLHEIVEHVLELGSLLNLGFWSGDIFYSSI